MEVDAELKAVLAKAPSWMQYNEETGLPNPLPSIPNLPPWLEWQRISYMVIFPTPSYPVYFADAIRIRSPRHTR